MVSTDLPDGLVPEAAPYPIHQRGFSPCREAGEPRRWERCDQNPRNGVTGGWLKRATHLSLSLWQRASAVAGRNANCRYSARAHASAVSERFIYKQAVCVFWGCSKR